MRGARSGVAERGSTRPRCSSPSTWNASDEEGELEVYIIDAELAAERLADTARYLVVTSGRPPDALRCPLLAALRSLGAATATGTAPARVPALLEAAQRRVAPLVDRVEGLGDDGQRVAFAVARLADALVEGRKHHPTAPADEPSEPAATATRRPPRRRPATRHRHAAPATRRPATRRPATRRPATRSPATRSPATRSPATRSPAARPPVTGPPSPTARPSSRGSRSRRGRPSRSGWPRAWPSSAAS